MSQILPYETRSTVPFVLMTDTLLMGYGWPINLTRAKL